ncbi:hypothetical protein M3Y97_00257600 [Aphelenchoides bicaudatus]|nr:hypothetical protein M3Y97_00257600 [Aphelenchoides bicaudatus]
MQILCIFILWIHLNDAGAAIEVSDFNTSKAKIVDEHAAKLIISKKEFLQKLLRSKECEKKSWYCNKSCYWEPQFFTEAMRHKFLAVNANTMACFGNNITYNFTAEVSNATIEHFSLIKNFPICWNSLAPFICDTHFRPWKGISYEVHGEPNELKHSNVMKIYSMKSCRNVRENCIFLKDYGINLKNLDCEGRSTALGLFETPSSALRKRRLLFSTEDCKIENSSNMNFTKAACLEPLVEVKNITNHNDSIIDSCYLGCRTSFAKKHQIDFLRFSILAFSIILAFAFLFAAAYTSRISFGYEQKIRKIFIQLMFGNSGILNLFMVVILVTPSLFETCTDINNTLIRAELEGDFNSCTISWVVLTFLLSASFVSFSLFMCQWILKPLGLPTSLEQWSNENKAAGKAITIFMCFFVYGCAFAMSIINLSFKAKVPGGMVNMCYILLDPITSNQIFYNFLFCMAIVVCLALSLRLLPALINLSKKCLNSEVQEEATEQPDQQNSTTNNHNLKAIVWKVIFCTIPLAIFVMFKMNSWFSFDQYHERLEIDQKIRHRFENESETSFIETECTFPSASNWDLLYFFTYAFVLPMFPFMVTFFATFFGQNALGIHKKNGWTDMKQLVVPEDKSCLLSNVAGLIGEETPCSFPKVPRSNTSRAKSLPVSINGYEKKYPYKSMGLRKKRTPESSINVGQEDHPVPKCWRWK